MRAGGNIKANGAGALSVGGSHRVSPANDRHRSRQLMAHGVCIPAWLNGARRDYAYLKGKKWRVRRKRQAKLETSNGYLFSLPYNVSYPPLYHNWLICSATISHRRRWFRIRHSASMFRLAYHHSQLAAIPTPNSYALDGAVLSSAVFSPAFWRRMAECGMLDGQLAL